MAIITISNTGGNWNDTATWIGGVVPTSADDVIATVLSGPLNLNTTAVAKSVDFTNYVNTLSLTSGTLSIAGNLTFSTGMTITGTSVTFAFNANATWTSNGKTWTGNYIINTSTLTITLADNAIIGGNITHSSSGGVHTFNGFTLSVNGNITASSGRTFTGTTKYIFSTTTTQTITVSGTFQSDIDINASGTVTFGTFNYNTGTLTYITGTVDTTGSTLNLSNAGTPTLATNGISWNNITISTGTIVTLTNALDVNGTFTYGSGGSGVTLNGSTATFAGNITASGTSDGGSTLSGTTNIIIDGTGTWSHDSTFNATITNNLTINTAGTLTLGSKVGYNTGTLTYIAGTVVTSGSTLTIAGSAILNLGLMPTPLNNLTTSGASPTITLLSDLYVIGTVTLSSSGTPVWTGNTLYIGGNLTHSTNSTQTGTTTFVMNGTGTWASTSINCIIRNNFTINTTGKITFGALIVYNTGTFTYLSGKVVVPKNSIMYVSGSTTFINCHKINFDIVQFNQNNIITMNEFFSGSPNKPVTVRSINLLNYNVTFQNGYEKIAKFVKVSNLTLTNTAASRGSLLILNNKGKYFRGSNNTGNIRYTNTKPNGIAKGDPTVPNQMTAPIGGYVSDPVFN